jgi:hypothetical protein
MPKTQQQNVLYLAVLPLVRITTMSNDSGYPAPLDGAAAQNITLFADKKFATEFFLDEVDSYLQFFKEFAEGYFTGGHVTGYKYEKEQAESGRIIVRVIQYVE